MSQFAELRLGSVWAVSQLLMRQNFTLIVYHVRAGNSALIKQSPVNRRIQRRLSVVVFKQRGACVWSRYQASWLGGIFCVKHGCKVFIIIKFRKQRTEDSCFGCLGATQVDVDSLQEDLTYKGCEIMTESNTSIKR